MRASNTSSKSVHGSLWLRLTIKSSAQQYQNRLKQVQLEMEVQSTENLRLHAVSVVLLLVKDLDNLEGDFARDQMGNVKLAIEIAAEGLKSMISDFESSVLYQQFVAATKAVLELLNDSTNGAITGVKASRPLRSFVDSIGLSSSAQ